MSGQGDHRRAAPVPGTDGAHQGQAVLARHGEIAHDHLERLPIDRGQGLRRGRGGLHRGSRGFQEPRDQLTTVGLVVDDEDPDAVAAGTFVLAWLVDHLGPGERTGTSGSMTVNVAPCPAPGLSAETVPPWSSTRCRTMARPRPRPPCGRLVVASACRKRSKTREELGWDPLPVVDDLDPRRASPAGPA